MNPTPNTRPRRALPWVVGVVAVFVMGTGIGLRTARNRAYERWVRVASHWEEEWLRNETLLPTRLGIGSPGPPLFRYAELRAGNSFREQRHIFVKDSDFALVLWQERVLFGSSVGARLILFGGHARPELVNAVRDIFAAVGVELSVMP